MKEYEKTLKVEGNKTRLEFKPQIKQFEKNKKYLV